MRLPVPGFVPVPAPEAMEGITVVLFLAGCCLAGTGALLLILRKRANEGPAPVFTWALLLVGLILMMDHGVQMLL